MVADMATDCEAARLLTIEAALKRDNGEPATKNVVMAKHFATEAAVRAARTAISLHGGVGSLANTLWRGSPMPSGFVVMRGQPRCRS
jgi:alkylation response protein AidB-like acyl-CoA dehydrogenase